MKIMSRAKGERNKRDENMLTLRQGIYGVKKRVEEFSFLAQHHF